MGAVANQTALNAGDGIIWIKNGEMPSGMIEALAGNGAALKNVQNATELLIFKNTTKHADDVVRLISEKVDDFVRVYSQFGDPAVDALVRCGSDAIGEIDTYGVRFFGLIDTYGDDFVSLYEKYGSEAVEQCLNHGDEVIELVGKYGDDCADLVMRYGDDVLEGISKHGDEFLERYAKEGDEFIEEYLEKGDGVFGVIEDLSKTALKHPLNRHMPLRVAKQFENMTEEAIIRYLDEVTFFNKSWTEEQIIEALNKGYKEALAKGINTGEYVFRYLEDNITIYLEESVFKSGYGEYKYTYKEIMELIGE